MSKLLKARQRADAMTAEASQAWAAVLEARKVLSSAIIPEGAKLEDLPELKASEAAMDAFDLASKTAEAAVADYDRLAVALGENDVKGVIPAAVSRIGQAAATVSVGREALDLGRSFTDSDVFAEVKKSNPSGPGRIGTTGSSMISTREQARAAITLPVGDSVIAPDQLPGIRSLPLMPALTILDLVSMLTTDSTQVKWVIEKLFTNNAAGRANGAAAAESNLELDIVKYDVKNISHFTAAPREIFDDVAGLQSLVDTKMIWGLRRKLASQLFVGDGLGENLTGIYNAEGIGSIVRAGVTADALIGSIFDAQQVVLDSYGEMPSATFLCPADYKTLRFARESSAGVGTATGGYLYGPPSQNNPIDIDGVLVLRHPDITAGNPITGVWRELAVWMHEGFSVSATDSHADYFTKRMIAIFANFRAAAGPMSTQAFCEVTQA